METMGTVLFWFAIFFLTLCAILATSMVVTLLILIRRVIKEGE